MECGYKVDPHYVTPGELRPFSGPNYHDDTPESLYEKTIQMLSHFDVIGFTEDLELFVDYIVSLTNWERLPSRIRNTTPPDNRFKLTHEEIKMIEKTLHVDNLVYYHYKLKMNTTSRIYVRNEHILSEPD